MKTPFLILDVGPPPHTKVKSQATLAGDPAKRMESCSEGKIPNFPPVLNPRFTQLNTIAMEGGDNAECAQDDIFKEFGEVYGGTETLSNAPLYQSGENTCLTP